MRRPYAIELLKVGGLLFPMDAIMEFGGRGYVCGRERNKLIVPHEMDGLDVRSSINVDGQQCAVEWIDKRWAKDHGVLFVGFRPVET